MPIPKPKSGEKEREYVSRCMSAISGEYKQDKASAICYSTYRESKKSLAIKFVKALAVEAKRKLDGSGNGKGNRPFEECINGKDTY